MPIRILAPALFTAFAFVSAAHADALVKPIPTPDVSRLAPAVAAQLSADRAVFDKARVSLVGDPLAQAYALMGSAYARAGFYDAAMVAMQDAAVLSPKDGRWVYAQGILARAQKHNAVALNYFELAYSLDQTYLPIRVAVAQSKFDNGDLDGARKLLAEYVAKTTNQAVPYALLGKIAFRERHYAAAIENLQRALALQPAANRLYTDLEHAQAALGDTDAAAASRARAGNTEPSLPDPLGDGLLGRASAPATPKKDELSGAALALTLHKYDAARKTLDAALKSHPNDATVLAMYARVEAAAGNLAAAKSRAAAAIAADPDSALAHLSQGVALEMGNDDKGAQRAYEQAIRADAKLVEPRLLLGQLLMRQGHYVEATAQLRELIRVDPVNAQAWMHLVASDVIQGKCETALHDVSDVLARDSQNKFLLQLFVRLASTCPAASTDERRGALEYGTKLYREKATAPVGETFALALAANGRWDDAVKTQQAAMFVLVRDHQKALLPAYREILQLLQAHKLPQGPWRASAAVFHPTRLAPDATPATAPAPRK